MIKIDQTLLCDVGLGALEPQAGARLLRHCRRVLELRVGIHLADSMSSTQLDEFETYFRAKDNAGASRWLKTHFPNYKVIVAEEFSGLRREIAAEASAILAIEASVGASHAAYEQQFRALDARRTSEPPQAA